MNFIYSIIVFELLDYYFSSFFIISFHDKQY